MECQKNNHGASNIKNSTSICFFLLFHCENMLLLNSDIPVLNKIVLYGINNRVINFKIKVKTNHVSTSDCVMKVKMWVSRFDVKVLQYQLLFGSVRTSSIYVRCH